MKPVYQTIAIVLLSLAICFAGCRKENTGHQCRFRLCPYKGYISFPGVINEQGGKVDKEKEGSDTWALDRLHFDYPNCSYDELEDKLINK